MSHCPDEKLFALPAGLDLDDQMIFCVGSITISWANCETLLRGIYEAIVGGKSSTASLHAMNSWFSHVNNQARIALLRRSILGSPLSEGRKGEGLKLVQRFDRYSQRRNQLAHAHYRIDPATRSLVSIEIYRTSTLSAEIKEDIEIFSEKTVRELLIKIRLLEALNRLFWKYLIAVQAELGSLFPILPMLPDGYLSA